MTQVLTWSEMRGVLPKVDLLDAMASAFSAYSRGEAVIPPVGELKFEHPPGDVHIKYGYLRSGSRYVVKIASGFYNNPQMGLPSSQGLMLLFSQTTGEIEAVLLDEGNLTDIRTAAAGALTVKTLAPTNVAAIGIVGTGIQARHQLQQIALVQTCRNVFVWGRTPSKVQSYIEFASKLQFSVTMCETVEELVRNSQIIITTTPSTSPLIRSEWVQPGTHITAVGADTGDKQELDSALLGRADRVISDSLSQAKSRGEVFQAVQQGALDRSTVVELGALLEEPGLGRTSESQITVADLTGVAVQDLAIANAVFEHTRR